MYIVAKFVCVENIFLFIILNSYICRICPLILFKSKTFMELGWKERQAIRVTKLSYWTTMITITDNNSYEIRVDMSPSVSGNKRVKL